MRTSLRFAVAVLAATASTSACAVGNGAPPTAASTSVVATEQPRSAAQAKLDGRLLDALERVSAGVTPASERNPLDLDAEGRVLVDITAVVTADLLQQIAVAGIVVSQFPQYEAIRARVPFDRLLSLAERVDVRFIRPAEQAVTNPVTGAAPR